MLKSTLHFRWLQGALGRKYLANQAGQPQRKDRTLTDLAGDGNCSSMCFRDFLHNGQSQSCAGGIFGPRPIGPVEPFKEMGNMFRLDSMAGILDGHGHFLADRMQTDGDGTTGRGIPECIVEQINQRLFQPLCIAEYRRNRLGFE